MESSGESQERSARVVRTMREHAAGITPPLVVGVALLAASVLSEPMLALATFAALAINVLIRIPKIIRTISEAACLRLGAQE